MKNYFTISVFLILLLNLFEYSSAKNATQQITMTDEIASKADSLFEHYKESVQFESDSIMKKLSIIEDKSTTNYWLNIIFPSAVAFITALSVTFFAAYLNRKAEYKKYIFQKRIDTYHEFFNELDQLLSNAFNLVLASNQTRNETGQPDQKIPWNVSKIFTPVKMKASIIYLLLNKKDKITFTNILDNIRTNIVSSCVDAKAYSFNVENHINELKELLNTTIINIKL